MLNDSRITFYQYFLLIYHFRNIVRDSGIGTLSQLDINILPEEFRRKMFKEKGQRTVKKKVKKGTLRCSDGDDYDFLKE